VIAHDPYVPESRREPWVEYVGLEELFRRADIVSLHARATKETAGIVGQELLGLMKPTACLVNTSRGELVDHDALYAALKEGRIAGAGLDIFEAEPPSPSSALFTLDNVVCTTHLAGASRQAAHVGAQVACQGIADFLAGRTPQFLANPETLTKEPTP
jgi:D-3-phosphoglycerate dehydrogenase